MSLNYSFAGIRLQDSQMTPVDWDIKVDLVSTEKAGKTYEEIYHLASVAYQKICFWLDTNLPSILICNAVNNDDLYIANLSANIMMYCPGNPTDDLIAQLLHAKLSTLSGEDLSLREITIKASDTSLSYTFDTPTGKYALPKKVPDYISTLKSRDETPWWYRDDGFSFEFILPENQEVQPGLLDSILDPMTEFYEMINETTEAPKHKNTEPAKIVKVEKWRPKIA